MKLIMWDMILAEEFSMNKKTRRYH